MLTINENDDTLEIETRTPTGQRVIFGMVALIPLLAPYSLIIRPNWDHYFNVVFLFMAVISLGAMVVSGLFILAAVAGTNTRLRFDRQQGLFTHTVSAPIIPARTSTYALSDIAQIEINQHDWSDGEPSYSLVVHTNDGSTFKTGSSWSHDDVQAVVERIKTYLS